MSGIRTRADLKARCTVDVDTGCWHWLGAVDSDGRPSFWFPPLKARVSLGVAASFFRTSQRPKPGTAWHCTCTTANCANPGHRTEGTRSSQMLAARLVMSPLTRARMSIARSASAKLTAADVAEIRSSGMSAQQVVARWDVSLGYAYEVRRGTRRASAVSQAPGSSVFAWRPEA